jgi:hypothetical protein
MVTCDAIRPTGLALEGLLADWDVAPRAAEARRVPGAVERGDVVIGDGLAQAIQVGIRTISSRSAKGSAINIGLDAVFAVRDGLAGLKFHPLLPRFLHDRPVQRDGHNRAGSALKMKMPPDPRYASRKPEQRPGRSERV